MELQEKQTSESRTSLHRDTVETMESPREYTFIEKMKRGVQLITVEPVLFLYLFATLLAGGVAEYMKITMACRVNAQQTEATCSNISVAASVTAVIQADMEVWSRPFQHVVSMIMVLCFGTFSDKFKIRKPFLILPILGEVFCCLGLLLCVAFITEWPVQVYFFMAYVLPAFFGGVQTVIMAIYSYVSDISTQEDRTFRIGFVEVVSLILTPLGSAIAGFGFLKIGSYGTLTIVLVLFVMALLYGQIFMKEKPPPKSDANLCLEVFNIKTVVVDMFKVLLQRRHAYRRFLLIMSYVCYVLIKGPMGAEGPLIKNYALTTFNWNVDKYGYYKALDETVHIIGMFIAITLFTKTFKMNDFIIAIISCIIKIVVGIWYAFGANEIMFCIGPLISVFSGLFIISLRSVVTKIVNPNEIAKAQALFAVAEALCPIIYNKMYANFLAYTMPVFYGAFYLLTSVLIIIPLILLLGMYLLYKHDLEHPQPEEEQQNEHKNGVNQRTDDIEIEKF